MNSIRQRCCASDEVEAMFRPLRAVMRSEAMRPPLLRVAAMQGKQRALLRSIAPRRGFASGRLVLNHSTNIDGLPTLLQKLLDHDDAITRIAASGSPW